MGKIELDHTGSGGGITLSSDGTDLLLDGTAIGGGGGGTALELYAENPSSPTAPSATGTNAVAIGNGANALGTNGIALGPAHIGEFAQRAFAAQTSTNTLYGALSNDSIAMGEFSKAAGAQAVAIGRSATATSIYSVAIGRSAYSAGSGSVAFRKSHASGSESFAAAIGDSGSTYGAIGSNSIAMGYHAIASGELNTAIGYVANATSGYHNLAIGGFTTAAAGYGTAINGGNIGCKVAADYGVAIGAGAKTSVKGKLSYSSAGSFDLGAAGDAQTGTFVLRSDTTDATSEALTTNNSTAGTTNQIILPNNSAYAFHGTIVARQQASAGTACAAWKVEGLIRREGSAGTTVLVNSATTVLDNTPSWGMALSADTTNGGLKIEVTGAAATNIRWVATINTSEVTY